MLTGDSFFFTRGESTAHRIRIRKRVEQGRLVKLARGVYYDAEKLQAAQPSQRFYLRSLAVGIAGSTLVGRSAASLWGLPMGSYNGPVEARGKSSSPPDIIRRYLSAADIVPLTIGDFRVALSSKAATVLDMCRWGELVEAVVIGEAALKRRMISLDEIDSLAENRRGCVGINKFRGVRAFMNGLSESPRESEVKVALFREGYPPPIQQANVLDAHGYFIARPDFLFPEQSVALEYDGMGKLLGEYGMTPDTAAKKERERERKLISEGVYPIRITKESFASGLWLTELHDVWGTRAPMRGDRWRGGGRAW